jgi:hypothetical protein
MQSEKRDNEMTKSSWIVCFFLAVAGYGPAAAAPVELPGKSLRLIANKVVTYRVRETHVKTGGLLPGEYEFRLKLDLWINRQELYTRKEEYEGKPIVPLVAETIDFQYTAIRAGGQRHELDGRQLRRSGNGGYGAEDARFKGKWDTSRKRFRSGGSDPSRPGPRGAHLAGVWVPALMVDFPEKLKLEKGFSWGQAPEEMPRRLERLAYLQQWRITGVEEIEGGWRMTLAAECEAEPDEHGQRAGLKRQVVYDTRKQLVVQASVAFETSGGPEAEEVELTMELEEQK